MLRINISLLRISLSKVWAFLYTHNRIKLKKWKAVHVTVFQIYPHLFDVISILNPKYIYTNVFKGRSSYERQEQRRRRCTLHNYLILEMASSIQLQFILCFCCSILLSQIPLLLFVRCSKPHRKTPPHGKCSSKY